MRTVFLVPRREDNGHRDKLWEYCRTRWESYFPDIPIYEGHHDAGPFNRSAAVNRVSSTWSRLRIGEGMTLEWTGGSARKRIS